MWYICIVKNTNDKIKKTESIRVDNEILSKVREYSKKTFIPIGKFYDIAVIEKLEKSK